jgi:3',5'-cyclic AMP phosphodiesterase CpdA
VTTHLVHISDPHIVEEGALLGGILDTGRYLADAVEHINGLDVDVDGVLVTGDLTDSGRTGQYEHLRKILERLDVPWWAIYGNHDTAGPANRVLGDHVPRSGCGGGCGVVRIGDIDVFTLNSWVAGEPGGRLRADELAWCDAELSRSDAAHRVLAFHHPPVAVGIAGMDAMGLERDSADLLAETILYRHHVDAVLCGHLHRMTVTAHGGTVAITAPSVAHTIAFDLTGDDALSFALEPPALLVHRFDAGTLSTHHVSIGNWPTKRVEL